MILEESARLSCPSGAADEMRKTKKPPVLGGFSIEDYLK
jgi:hypothetical protein